MRLDSPSPGVAIVGMYGTGTQVNASMTVLFYGDTADEHSAASERLWRAWLTEFQGGVEK